MQSMTDSVALALPLEADLPDLQQAIGLARKNHRETEVRIGVGTVPQGIPLRILGYAGLVIRSFEQDIPLLLRQQQPPLTLFSSVAKVADVCSDLDLTAESILTDGIRGVISLAVCLRILDLENPIRIELAAPEQEVEVRFEELGVNQDLAAWFSSAAENCRSPYPWHQYAVEHASPTMFSDVRLDDSPRRLVVFIGGRTEAPFWAIRRLVRRASQRIGMSLNDSCGLILRRAKRPWYLPTETEPTLTELANLETDQLARLIKDAYNPTSGGNSGLKAEFQQIMANLRNEDLRSMAASTATLHGCLGLLGRYDIQAGPRLSRIVQTLLGAD